MPLELAMDQPFGNTMRQVTRMMEQLQKGFFGFCPSETWTPSVNLYEADATYLVCVDLAGVDKEKIELEVVDGRLRLRGVREVPERNDSPDASRPRLRVHLMEIDHGAFCRDVQLPQDVAHDKINASYRNGMLWVELPKK